MSIQAFQVDSKDAFSPEPTGPSLMIQQDPIGTGCMACCSGGVDPTWGGVASASQVAL
jgi:hypothetical protein